MASLRAQHFDRQYAAGGTYTFKGSGRDAAYRGAARTTMTRTGSSTKAHNAGMAASKRAAQSGGSPK